VKTELAWCDIDSVNDAKQAKWPWTRPLTGGEGLENLESGWRRIFPLNAVLRQGSEQGRTGLPWLAKYENLMDAIIGLVEGSSVSDQWSKVGVSVAIFGERGRTANKLCGCICPHKVPLKMHCHPNPPEFGVQLNLSWTK